MKISFNNKQVHTDATKRYSKYGPTKRHIAKWQWYLIVLILISPLLFIFYKIITSQVDDTFRGFVYFNTIKVISPEDGYIVKDNIAIGSKVKKGQELIVFGSELLRKRLKYLEKRLDFLKKRKKETIKQNSTVYKKFLKKADSYLQATDHFMDKTANLRQRGLGTIYQVHGAIMDDFNVLMSRELLKYNRFYYQAEVTRLGKDIIDTKQEIETIKEKLKEFQINSPVNGEIVKLNCFKGEYIPKNEIIALLADYDTMYIRAYMPPKILDDGGPIVGRKVDIFFGQKFNHTFVRTGTIVGVPSTTENDAKVLIPEERNTVLYIKVGRPIPANYYTIGYPVKVRLQNA